MNLELRRLFLAAALLCFSCGPALAYIDPGTGSIMLQAVIGAVAGALVVCKVYWAKIVGLFSGRSRAHPHADRKDSE
jgi:hypothetical protein